MEQDSSGLERALLEAEETIRRVLERALGARASDFEILLSVYYDEKGVAKLSVEVRASRRGAPVEDIIEAAIAAGVERFERVAGVKGGRKGKAGRGAGGAANPQER